MLKAPLFRNMGLRVVFFTGKAEAVWDTNKFKIDVSVETISAPFGEFVGEKSGLEPHEDTETTQNIVALTTEVEKGRTLEAWKTVENTRFEAAKQALLLKSSYCMVCEEEMAFLPENGLSLQTQTALNSFLRGGKAPLVAPCYHCNAMYHLTCLGSVFLDEDEEEEEACIVPRQGQCLGCKKVLNWPEVAKLATGLRKYALQDVVVVKGGDDYTQQTVE